MNIKSHTSFGLSITAAAALIVLATYVALMWTTARADTTYTNPVNPAISTTLGLGAQNSRVSTLQQFLASNSTIYPAGLVTGYYGPMTAAAVSQFQLAYNISPVGNVGPVTLAKMNTVIASGYGLDISAPIMSTAIISTTSNTATLSWTTNEFASGIIYYSTSPINSTEVSATNATQAGWDISANGNTLVLAANATSQSGTITNLQNNTTYYYMIKIMDRSGNVTVQPYNYGTFHTSN